MITKFLSWINDVKIYLWLKRAYTYQFNNKCNIYEALMSTTDKYNLNDIKCDFHNAIYEYRNRIGFLSKFI